MPSSALVPFFGGLGSLINPFKQKGTLFNPGLLSILGKGLRGVSTVPGTPKEV